MEFDNVKAHQGAWLRSASAARSCRGSSLGAGHVRADHMHVVPLQPRAARRVGLVRLRGKRGTGGVKVVAQALMSLRRVPVGH